MHPYTYFRVDFLFDFLIKSSKKECPTSIPHTNSKQWNLHKPAGWFNDTVFLIFELLVLKDHHAYTYIYIYTKN